MKIGFHTDAFNSAYGFFDKCLAWAKKNDVHYIECGLIDGVSWLHGLGYQPHVALYEDPVTCLIGEHPIEIIAQAKSTVDGNYYPMAFTSSYGKWRAFHCTLGHDVKALSVPGVQELYRRGCAWAAGLMPVACSPAQK